MKMKSLSLALAAAAIAFSFTASNAEARPPSQVPSGYKAYVDQKAKSAKMDCCKGANMTCMKTVALAVDGAGKAPQAFHDRKHGGGGYIGGR